MQVSPSCYLVQTVFKYCVTDDGVRDIEKLNMSFKFELKNAFIFFEKSRFAFCCLDLFCSITAIYKPH